MRIISCLTAEHNVWLVLLSALTGGLGAWAFLPFFLRARARAGGSFVAWAVLGAIAAGVSVWCTHFVAMLAYKPPAPISFDPGLTALSLLLVITTSFASFSLGAQPYRWAPESGGALFGAGVAAMHYTGMAAFSADAIVQWHSLYLAASVLIGVALSVLAFNRAVSVLPFWQKAGSPLMLMLAVVSLHFVGMAAMTVFPLAPSDGALTSSEAEQILAYSIAAGALMVMGIVSLSHFVDRKLQQQLSMRLRHLVESSVDGMLVEQSQHILEVNAAFEHLGGRTRSELVGAPIDASGLVRINLKDGAISRTTLKSKHGDAIPVEVVANRDGNTFDRKSLRIYAIRDIRPRLEQERRIVRLARTDHLTGLPNRAAFVDHLEQLLAGSAEGSLVALIAIDLNRFKEVNDVHGHAAGDLVLRVLSERMGSVLRDGEFIARLGGDEFVAAAPVPSRAEALDLASRLETQLFSTIRIDYAEAVCGGSLGIALYPEHAPTATALMNNADLAMYRAKHSHAENICFYVEAMDEAVRLRRRMIADLRDALSRGEFELQYQSQMDLISETITGYEALLRWRHPEHGLIRPTEFIPLAEETGLIVSFGEWALRTACKEAAAWKKPLTISVNVSAIQMGQADLAATVHQILLETGLPPSRLEIEITETALMKNPQRATHALRRLKTLGVSIAIDDFGTGYSSLSTLRAFAFDRIKLDKSFIKGIERDPQARTVLLAVLALGNALSIPVLVEGVETKEQLDFLRNRGCEKVQGYLVGYPMPMIEHQNPVSRIIA